MNVKAKILHLLKNPGFSILLGMFAIIGFISSIITIYPIVQNYLNNQNAYLGILITNQQGFPQYHSIIIYNYGNSTSTSLIFTVSNLNNSSKLKIDPISNTTNYYINNSYFYESPNISISKNININGRYFDEVKVTKIPKDKFIQLVVFNSTPKLIISQISTNNRYCISSINETFFYEVSGNIFIYPKNSIPINLHILFTNLGPSCIKPNWVPLPVAWSVNNSIPSYFGELIGISTLKINQSIPIGISLK